MKSRKNVKKEGKYIWATKIGEKGQMVIPKEAREVFNIKNGDTLLLFGDMERGIAIVKKDDCIKFAEKIFSLSGDSDDSNK